MLILDPTADLLILDPLASDWLVLVIDSAGATAALKGNACVQATVHGTVETGPMWSGQRALQATVQGSIEAGPVWSGQLVISPTFSGAVEIEP